MSYTQSGESVFSKTLNQWIEVDALQHSYAYNTDGTLSTDSVTDGKDTWVKTYAYSATGSLLSETAWVRQ